MPRLHSIKLVLLLLSAAALSLPLEARVQITNIEPGLALHCTQPAPGELRCQVRLPDAAVAEGISLAVGDRPVRSPGFRRYPQPDEQTAIMLVIDLGPGMPLHSDRRLFRHVGQLLEKAQAHHQVGLAAFVDQLRMISPVGVPLDEIQADLATLKSSPHSSSLYGVLRETINMLAFQDADRRAIVLLSNGGSANDAERHAEVVAAARNLDVSITSLAYPGGANDPGLNALRKLSDDTGGRFVSVDEPLTLQAFLAAPFETLDSGGRLDIDLGTPEMANLMRGSALLLNVHTRGRGVRQAMLSLDLEPEPAFPGDPSLAFPAPSAGPQQRAAAASPMRGLGAMAYVVLGIGLLFIIGGILLLMRRPAENIPAEAPESGPGFLLHLSHAAGMPVRLESDLISIGRNADNDIRLDDASVSRHHAHIQLRTDGNYIITDLDSLNGIYINNRQIKSTLLAEGDELEIGDIRMRFTLHPPQQGMLPAPK